MNRRHGSPRRPRPALLTLLPLLIAATCGPEPQALPMVEGSGELKPPSSFAALWYEMENCTGRRKDFRVVRWYVVPTADWAGFECEAPEGCNGQYHKGTIYLADHKVQSKDTVRHEILHALGLFHEDAEFWRCLGKPMPDRYKRQRRGAP